VTQLTVIQQRPLNRAWLAALFIVISALTQSTGDNGQDVAHLAGIVSHEPALRGLELVAERLQDDTLTLSVQYCRELYDEAFNVDEMAFDASHGWLMRQTIEIRA
jgi:hypothetical protein